MKPNQKARIVGQSQKAQVRSGRDSESRVLDNNISRVLLRVRVVSGGQTKDEARRRKFKIISIKIFLLIFIEMLLQIENLHSK